jgi:hypothetical protein
MTYIVEFYRRRYRWKNPSKGVDRWVPEIEHTVRIETLSEIDNWWRRGYRVNSIEPIGSDDEF